MVHFDPPNDHKDYLHRSGRTARAGADGTVVALVQPEQLRDVQRLQAAANVDAVVEAVHPHHPAVLDLGSSGEPVVVRAPAPSADRPAQGGRGERPRRGPGRRYGAGGPARPQQRERHGR